MQHYLAMAKEKRGDGGVAEAEDGSILDASIDVR
jgi:hypothetical protein